MSLSFSRKSAAKSNNSLGKLGGSIFTVLLATLEALGMIAKRVVGSGNRCSPDCCASFLAPELLTQPPFGAGGQVRSSESCE